MLKIRNECKGHLAGVALLACVALAAAAPALAAGPRGGAAPKAASKQVDSKASAPESAVRKQKPAIGDEPSAMGRLVLTIVDQEAMPLERATVDVRSSGGAGSYRERATTDGLGRVTFNSVPLAVNISVTAENGFLSQEAQVPQTGNTDFRLIVPTVAMPRRDPVAEASAAADAAFQGR